MEAITFKPLFTDDVIEKLMKREKKGVIEIGGGSIHMSFQLYFDI